MKPLQFFAVILVMVSCKTQSSEKTSNSTIVAPNTKLKATTDSLLATFKGNAPNAVLAGSSWIDLDSLRNLISMVGLFDIKSYESYNVSNRNCNGIEEISWVSKKDENIVKRIILQSFVFNYIDTLLGDHNKVLITDYEIYRSTKPYYITLSVCEGNIFEQLIVDSVKFLPEKYERIVNHVIYKPYFFEDPLGFEEAQAIFELKKKACR